MLFAEWIGDSVVKTPKSLRRIRNVVATVERGDIVEVHASTDDKKRYVCRCNGCNYYFWGNEADLKFCIPVDEFVIDDVPEFTKRHIG
jgi:hypothetical protein